MAEAEKLLKNRWSPKWLHALAEVIHHTARLAHELQAERDPRKPWRTVVKIYVGNMSFDTSEDTLRDAFAAHGDVAEVAIITATSASCGFRASRLIGAPSGGPAGNLCAASAICNRSATGPGEG
jgi:hypothetical protein